MTEFFGSLTELNITSVTYRIILAFLIGGLIGIDRGKHGRAAGMRTHILVCVASSLAASLGLYITQQTGNSDAARIAAQVIAAMGVVCAGSVMIKNIDIITGLTTAVGMFTTSVIGLSIGFGFYEGALIATIITIIAMSILNYFETSKLKEIRFYIEINDVGKINKIMSQIDELDENGMIFVVSTPKSGINGNVGLYIKAYCNKSVEHKRISEYLKDNILKIENVVYLLEESALI